MRDAASAPKSERSRRDIYHDQVIEAAYLHTKPGCFYIGPFARRVSFASQQHRGLDLVAALADRGKLRHRDTGRPKTIAVIGAGIAGITVLAALRGQGCTVHLYEAAERPLMVQEHARHRLIHPNIARWPAGKLALTTEFAFLDWFAAPSDQVIASFRREWERWLKPEAGDRNCLFLEAVKVTDLACDADIVRLTRVARDPTRKLPENRYDYAFVTTGFAEEDKFGEADFVSYWDWTDDQVEAWRADQRNVYISGCGDGGMIDALRLVHGDFDRGWLAIRLAHVLGDWRAGDIVDAENEAMMAAKSLACMNLSAPNPVETIGASNRKVGARFEDDEIVRRLEVFYRTLVEDLPFAAATLLSKSLDAGNVEYGRVTLISRKRAPFGPYAAPIHKIMVAHAINQSRLRFRQGELKDRDGALDLDWVQDGGTHRLTDQDGLIVRHGSPANLTGLASEAESESLRIRQFMIADYIDPELDRSMSAPEGYPTRETEADRFVGARLDMVRTLVDAILPGAAVDAVRPASPADTIGGKADPDAHGYIYLAPDQPVRDRAPLPVDMPNRVFGMTLNPGEPRQLEALL